MTWLRTFLSRFHALFRRQELEEELDEEMRFHLQMEVEENVRRGMSPEDARCAARLSFGSVDGAKEAWRDRRWLPQVGEWLTDLRFGVRNLSRSPGFAAFAVLSLALGIGTNTAIFTALRTLVLQPLPYPEPWRLVRLFESMIWDERSTYGSVSVPNLADWREQNAVFENIAAFALDGVNLTHGEGTSRRIAAVVEPGVFPIIGIKPLRGRTFLPGEDRAGGDRVVVLSHELWQTSFGADPGIIGRKLRINGAGHVVVGIMPAGFRFPPRSPAELWVPLVFPEFSRSSRGSHWLNVIARLKPGISWTAASLQMTEVARRLEKQYPETNAARGVRVEPLHLETVRSTAQILLVLFGAVGLILLLACANVAHLVLARAAGRRRELAVRMSLGAGRWRVVRLLLAETAVLAVAGGVMGFVGGRWCLNALLVLAQDHLPAAGPMPMDRTVVWFCAAASLFSALLAGLIPALTVSRIDLQSALKEAGSSVGPAVRRGRSALMVCEVALALTLAVGALLLIRSLGVLNRLDLGFQPERVLTMRVALPETGYQRLEQTVTFYDRLLEQVRTIPAVSSAGVINCLPIQPWAESLNFTIQGREMPRPGHEPGAELRRVSPGYFQAMGIPVLAGRSVSQDDNRADGQRTVLISRETAQRYFPDENPVGMSIRFGPKGKEGGWVPIVGIVGDVRERGVYRPAPAIIYEPYAHSSFNWKTMTLVVRAAVEPEALTRAVRRLVWQQDPDAAVFLVKTMESVVSDSVAGTRLLSRLLAIFSSLALVLAAVGVYGVMSQLVSQRTHEIGVRMALGAARGRILRLVIARGVRNALAGVAVGLSWTVMAGFAMRRFVIGIHVVDISTYLIAASGIIAVVALATCVPAWRASRVDPLAALREE